MVRAETVGLEAVQFTGSAPAGAESAMNCAAVAIFSAPAGYRRPVTFGGGDAMPANAIRPVTGSLA